MSCIRTIILAVGAALAAPAAVAQSQAFITVVVNSGAAQTLASIDDNTTNNFSAPVSITTQWRLFPFFSGSVSLVAWFSNPAQALASGAESIPSNRMRGRMTTGLPVAFTAFTQPGVGSAGSAGGSLLLFRESVLFGNRNRTRTDNLELQLDLTGYPVLTPGTYSGIMTIKAITQ